MKRFIDSYLNQWVKSNDRKPLLLRGARQVGKTYAVRNLGAKFKSFVEINCEELTDSKTIFEKDLKPDRIIQELSLLAGKTIHPKDTLLFLDEIQEVPRAILALRYFYEKLPELKVIAAGSLLDFALEKVGIPVGRVDTYYMFPVSWVEFLLARGEMTLLDAMLNHDAHQPFADVAHNKLLTLLGEYFAIGGMPKVVKNWVDKRDPYACFKIQQALIADYQQDFEKYATKYQVRYVELLFDQVPRQLGQKFKFSALPGDYRKRELLPCLDLLVKAGAVHKIYHTSAQGLPLGASIDLNKFKVIFLDIGLAQALLNLDLKDWFINPTKAFLNQGAIVEAFVGQEMMAYSHAFQKRPLYYWHRDERGSQAEVDYVTQLNGDIIPIEVKSGTSGHMRSLSEYLSSHPNTPYSIRFSGHNYSQHEGLHSYPLYAIAKIFNIVVP